MNNIPINQTILATLAFSLSNWRKLLEASIFPILMCLPLATVLPELMNIINSSYNPEIMLESDVNFPLIYLLMFIYATLALLMNVYRIVVSGNNSIARLGIVIPNLRVGRFLLLSIPLVMGQIISLFIPFLFPIVYLLLIPISLNLISIANDVPYKSIQVSFRARLNIFIINFIAPFLFITLLGLIGNSYLDFVLTFFSIFWTSISLALCYAVIMANSSAQSH